MEIPDPPSQPVCGACNEPLLLLFNPRRGAWVAWIAAPDGGPHAITPHTCRHGQDPITWKQVRPPSTPTPEYLAARAALGKTETRTDEEEQRWATNR